MNPGDVEVRGTRRRWLALAGLGVALVDVAAALALDPAVAAPLLAVNALAVAGLAAWAWRASGRADGDAVFRRFVENQRTVCWMADLARGRILYVNPAFEEIWGRPAPAPGTDVGCWSESIHPEDRQRVLESRARQLALGGPGEAGPVELDYRIVRPDGTTRAIHDRGWAVRDGSGRIVRLVGLARDVTAQVEAERALREREAVLRSFYDGASLAMGVVETAGGGLRVVTANAATCRLLGVPPGAADGRSGRELGLDDDRIEQILGQFREGVRRGGAVRFELKTRIPGAPPWLALTISPVAGVDGRSWFSYVIEDISAAKQREAERDESERRYRELFEANPHPMWVFDEQTLGVLAVNEAAVRAYGYSREEFLALTISDIRPTGDVPRLLEQVRTPRPRLGQADVWVHRRKDGTLFEVEVTCSALEFHGRPARLVLALDVTERRRAERALRRRNEELEALQAVAAALGRTTSRAGVLAALGGALADRLGLAGGCALVGDRPGRLDAGAARDLPDAVLEAVRQQLQPGGAARGATPGGDGPPADLLLADAPDSARHALCIPLPAGVGTLCLFDREPMAVDSGGVAFFELLGRQAGAALRNAMLFEQARARRRRLKALSRRLVGVQEAERRRIARELHDEVGQVLTGLKLALELVGRSPCEQHAGRLEAAQGLVDRLLRQVRRMSLDLRPAMLDDLGLLPALLWLIERYTVQTGIHVDFEHADLERRFSPEVETAAYRIAQEALTNCARHSGVDRAAVRLWAGAESLVLRVEDGGRGFDPRGRAASPSSGLSGMRERALLLGGQLAVESVEGRGTVLTAELPLAGRRARAHRR